MVRIVQGHSAEPHKTAPECLLGGSVGKVGCEAEFGCTFAEMRSLAGAGDSRVQMCTSRYDWLAPQGWKKRQPNWQTERRCTDLQTCREADTI